MISILLAASLLSLTLVVGLLFYLKGLKNRITPLLDYFSSENPEEPSDFALEVQELATKTADAIGGSLKGKFAGSIGAVAKQEKAIMNAVMKDKASQAHPLLGAAFEYIQQNYPSVAGLLERNPSAPAALFNMVSDGRMPLDGLIGNAQSNGHRSDYAQRLAKYG